MSQAELDAPVVARAIEGDADALAEIVRQLRDPLYRLALRMVGRPADAEDAVQEILIKTITRLASWRGEAALLTWAYRLAMNYLLNLRRNPYERREISFESLGAELATGIASTDYAGPEAQLLATEVRLSCTQAMLQCLDRTERATFVLGEVFELNSEEAGWILDITPAAYRQRLGRARQRIRAFMTSTCGLVNPAKPCRCARRVNTAIKRGNVNPRQPVFATHPTTAAVAAGHRQMHELHDAATVLRSHPDYAAPKEKTEAIVGLLRSGRYPMLS
ncbi:MAG TPA: RNA polymerase sigma factor [Pseudonocardiaceae bacterium]|nr:RNA polymerase sigma factor [Pseudonocardiaceae bacterium]